MTLVTRMARNTNIEAETIEGHEAVVLDVAARPGLLEPPLEWDRGKVVSV